MVRLRATTILQRKSLLLLMLWAAACMLLLGQCASRAATPRADVRGEVDPGAAQAARRFLNGWADGNKQLLRGLMAKEPANFYGPCLFCRMPALSNARVKEGQGMVDFDGEATDPTLPPQGTILMNFKNLGSGRKWYVRAIVWKGADALSYQMLGASPTGKDRAQEGPMRAVASRYLQAWLRENWPAMQALTFDWLARKKSPLQKEVSIRSLKLRSALRPDGSVRVDFTVTGSPRSGIAGFVKRTASGKVYLVKEAGEWKVRGITASL